MLSVLEAFIRIYIKDCFLNKNNDVCMNGTKEIKDVSDARVHHFLRL